MNLVIDTDIGTDVDDAFALVYALRLGKVKAITVSQGNPTIRAKIAKKLEKMLNVDVPIISGLPGTIEATTKYWTGIEEKALTPKEKEEEFISKDFPYYDKESRLVCIAPMSNIAHQLSTFAGIRKVNGIYIMGSHEGSQNFKADLDAANKVMGEEWKNRYIITKETSQKVAFSRDELIAFKGSELGDFLYDSAIRWLDFAKKNESIMYDVLAVSAAMGEDYVKFEKKGNNYISVDVDKILKKRIIEA